MAPEVQWLRELLKQEDWQKALKVAEQLLVRGGYSALELAEINYAVCRARAHSQELLGAIPAGLLAEKLAADQGNWDLFGRAALVVGVCYIRTRRCVEGRDHLLQYFHHFDKYSDAREIEGRVWQNLGMAYYHQGRLQEAIGLFQRARAFHGEHGDLELLYVTDRHLVMCYLDVDMDKVSQVLRELRAYRRKYPADQVLKLEYLWCRAIYALRTGAHGWAASFCLSGLMCQEKSAAGEFHLKMTLSEALAGLGSYKDALGYALSARITALQARHYDLEFLATEAMYNLMASHGGNLIHELDAEYLGVGLDISPYLDTIALPERRLSLQ